MSEILVIYLQHSQNKVAGGLALAGWGCDIMASEVQKSENQNRTNASARINPGVQLTYSYPF